MKKVIPQIGERYGMMEIVCLLPDKITKSGNTETQVLCQCDCGNIKSVIYRSLRYGNTTSCGCNTKKAISLKNRAYNTYYIDGDITRMYDSQGNYTLIDTEDIEKVKPHYFTLGSKGYWQTTHSHIRLNRFIMDCPEGMVVDHISHDKADNRKCNLRICTIGQNNMNHKRKGYCFNKEQGKWVAYCSKNGKRHFGGYYDTEDEAALVASQLRNELFDEYAYKGE